MIGTMRDHIAMIETEHLLLVRIIAEGEKEIRRDVTKIVTSQKRGKIGTRGPRDPKGTKEIRISKTPPNFQLMTRA